MKIYKLSELGELKNGLNFERRNIVNSCKIIGVGDFANNVYPNYATLGCIERALVPDDFLLEENDIIFVRSNGNKSLVGRTMLIKDLHEEITYSGFSIRFRLNSKEVCPEYLFYALRSPYCRKQYSYSQQTNITNLSQDILGNVIVRIPNLQEQKRVAQILSNIDNKIMNNSKINDNLSKMIGDTYNHMFVRSQLPSSWANKKLSDAIVQINTGLNPRDNFCLGNGTIKYITVKNLTTDGTLDFSNCDTINPAARQIIHNRSDISVGDILFASIAPLGRCFLIQTPPTDWDINESVFSIRANTELVSSEYLYSYFTSDQFIAKAQSSSTGSIFKGIRIGTLLDMDIVIPPFELINEFTNTTKSLFKAKQRCIDESQQLTKLRDWLLPMLMNGQATIDD